MSYRCVNCGKSAAALYKTYGPTVIKLNKCEHCKAVVDKYIEYDPVIVMIDLVLISKEAQSHVLYNTEFKFYWKLLILVLLLETFSVWKGDSLLSMAVYSLCRIHNENTAHVYLELPWNVTLPLAIRQTCDQWTPTESSHVTSQAATFIWEKHFYVHFLATAFVMLVMSHSKEMTRNFVSGEKTIGFAIFMIVLHLSMTLISSAADRETVTVALAVKALTVGGTFAFLSCGVLVWGGNDWAANTRALHHALVALYALAAHVKLTQVTYGLAWWWSIPVLLLSSGLRLMTVFTMTAHFASLLQYYT